MVFVDTGAWIALSDKSDVHHLDAVAIYTRLKQRRERFLTTDYVIDETVTRLRYDAGHPIAVQFLELLEQSESAGSLRIARLDAALFKDAVVIFRQYDSVVLSFTDCASFAACRLHNVHEAFAFDQHFTMQGITLSTK